jgi:hypothetical protein
MGGKLPFLLPLFPAEAGTQAFFSFETFEEIPPSRVEALDQHQLPGSSPFLHLSLSRPGALSGFVGFIPDKALDIVFCSNADKVRAVTRR